MQAASARVIAGAAVATQEMVEARGQQAAAQQANVQAVTSLAAAQQAMRAEAAVEERAREATGRIRETEHRVVEAETNVAANAASNRADFLQWQRDLERQAQANREEQYLAVQRAEAAKAQAEARTRAAEETLERERICAREVAAVLGSIEVSVRLLVAVASLVDAGGGGGTRAVLAERRRRRCCSRRGISLQ